MIGDMTISFGDIDDLKMIQSVLGPEQLGEKCERDDHVLQKEIAEMREVCMWGEEWRKSERGLCQKKVLLCRTDNYEEDTKSMYLSLGFNRNIFVQMSIHTK
jgi:hypothetical protein